MNDKAVATVIDQPTSLVEMAIQKGADLDQLERLIALQERHEAGEARKAFVVALSAFKADPPAIIRDREINHNGKHIAKYAGLDQVSSVIGKALSAHGLSHRWDTEQADGQIKVTCILTHEMGHEARTTLEAGADTTGAKNSVQAIGSTVTYLQRYTLLAATGMATGEQDDDGAAVTEVITAEQKEELIAMMKETDTDTAKFLAFLKAKSLDELTPLRFTAAKNALKEKKKANAST
jgi:hypothetical protein